jgi:hypothetical protein
VVTAADTAIAAAQATVVAEATVAELFAADRPAAHSVVDQLAADFTAVAVEAVSMAAVVADMPVVVDTAAADIANK